jgi:hypothetical protein
MRRSTVLSLLLIVSVPWHNGKGLIFTTVKSFTAQKPELRERESGFCDRSIVGKLWRRTDGRTDG